MASDRRRGGRVRPDGGRGVRAPCIRRLPVAGILLASLVGLSGPAFGQAGWYVTPTLSLTEEFDSNVFADRSGSRSDFVTRSSVGLGGGYQSEPLTLTGRYTLDSELYARHTELNDVVARQLAEVHARYLPGRVLTLDLAASYTETNNPSDLTPETGIQLARATARSVTVTPSAAYRLSETLSTGARYSYEHTTVSGGVPSDSYRTALNLDWIASPLDTATVTYGVDVVETGASETGAPSDSTLSQVLTLGWRRQLTARTWASVAAGPRVTEGDVDPEVNLTIQHQWSNGSVSLFYVRTQDTVPGESGTVETNSLRGSLTWNAARDLTATFGTGVQITSGRQSGTATVYSATASLTYQLARYTTLSLTYAGSLQRDDLGEIRRHVVSLALTFSYPTRVW